MKFRCRMIDIAAMRDFTNIVNTVSRMSKKCVIRLTPEFLCFNIGDEHVPVVWAELRQARFFHEYELTGAYQEQNEIYLELDTLMLARSVSSLKQNAKSAKIKLSNKQQPCLTIEIELPSSSMDSRQCVHDVPVQIIPRRQWNEYQAPNIPEFDISLEMPQLKHVRNMVERMKNMSPFLILGTHRDGKLILKVENDVASIATYFPNLKVWCRSNLEEEISASVDIKKFHTFLSWDIIHPDSVKCNILHDRTVNLHLCSEGYLTIHYFMPAIAS
ncbi:checkpoint protein HUS1 isoform X1 [Leptopilina boulardi]|uniref:checkpoint protein HUS1 isoform X1 n=2 Tax=Leptopilina boulardi TaxID=63433 RepID=UPI0021F562BD|nr:checkpoint protein HUS1 isoform X1 [Leptopilina boulardi]